MSIAKIVVQVTLLSTNPILSVLLNEGINCLLSTDMPQRRLAPS